MVDTSLLAVFLLGLFGGVHCAGMCGGIVAALGMASARTPARRETSSVAEHRVAFPAGASTSTLAMSQASRLPSLPWLPVIGFNLSRVLTYTLLGALAGAVGSLAFLMERMLPVQQAALVLANTMLVLMGLYVFGFPRIVQAIEQIGSPLWRRIQPLAVHALGDRRRLWLAGALWGLVPCGMVYTVLIASMTTASPVDGAMLMAVFGLGTVPNLVAMGLSVGWLARVRRNRWLRRGLGVVFVVLGLAGLFKVDAVLGLPIIGELCFRPV